jgi:hypothetical protein
VKVFTGDPVRYAAILIVLLGFRVAWQLWTHRSAARATAVTPRA